MGSLRSIRVFLLGDVRKPGAFVVSSLSTMTNALLVSGGIKEIGSLRNIQLKRKGEVVARLDLYDLLLKGDTSADAMVLPGDVIFVPTVGPRATLSGAVLRPAQYELLGGEALSDIIALGGGVGARGDDLGIRLERLGSDRRPLVRNLQMERDSEFPIAGGDLISVPSASIRVGNVISLAGNVERPGDYEWKSGLRIGDLIPDANALLSGTDYNYALIRREHSDGSLSVKQFQPIEVFRDLSSPFNLELRKRDTVYFFSNTDRETRERLLSPLMKELSKQSSPGEGIPVVSVSGMVHFPGDYPLARTMRLTDLFNAAGGMRDAAHALSSELTRMKVNESTGAEIDHILVQSLSSLDANDTSNLLLQPYDSLNVKPIPSWREREVVEILGEVRFPGSYPIKLGETLAQVVSRAGGLTEQAFSTGAIFSRESLKIKEQKQRDRLIAQLESDVANLSIRAESQSEAQQAQSVASSLLARLKTTESQGRLVLPSQTFIATNKSSIEVRGGDRLFIPRIPYEVSVVGEVQFPTSHLYEKSLSKDDFIKRSGGFTANADKDRVFVVRANGSVLSKGGTSWFGGGDFGKGMSAGDVIVVPINMEKSRLMENIVNGTQIVYQLAVAAAAVNSF
jgi:polysaccharide biosynthesis/export protein